MLKSNNHPPLETFHFPNSRTLWHDSALKPRSLGCQQCPYLDSCGGLHVGAGVFDCLTYCRCADPSICDNVCPNNERHFVARSMEVRGILNLCNVPEVSAFSRLFLPNMVPMIYHSSARTRAPAASAVALSLYEVVGKKNGAVRFPNRQAMLDYFKLGKDTTVILSGTDVDKSLERWWKLPDRGSVIKSIKKLGVRLITTPNFSLFDDVPRHDNMYNMKRIALAWLEIQRYGIPCALHLNARTDRDWERWVEFLNTHPEIDYVAFEFGTGAGAKSRIGWYVEKLVVLARAVERPLHLVARGGLSKIGVLADAFDGVTVIETNAFMRAQKRRRGVFVHGKLSWEIFFTPHGHPIDDLFDANIGAMREYISKFLPANESTQSISEESAGARRGTRY